MLSKRSLGFTIVELLIVISVIGVLSAVLIAVINPRQKENEAKDVAVRARIFDLVKILETIKIAEGYYPDNAGVKKDGPLKGDDEDMVANYFEDWPKKKDYFDDFWYTDLDSGTNFVLYSAISNGNILKYSTAWKEIKECESANKNILLQLGTCP